MSSIVFTVEMKVKDEFIEIVYPFMQALHKLTHELDSGCVQYDLYRDKKDDSKFYFIEEWKDQESLDAHSSKEHFKNFMEFVEGKFESVDKKFEKIDRSDLEKYEEIK